MTTIFYDGVDLHADTRVVTSTIPARIRDGATKLFTSQNNVFHYGIAGRMPRDDHRLNDLEPLWFKMLYAFSLVGESIRYEELRKIGFTIEKITWLQECDAFVVAKCTTVRYGAEHISVTGGTPSVMGSGGYFLLGAHAAGRSIADCFKITNRLDNLTSATFETLRVDTLNDLVIGG